MLTSVSNASAQSSRSVLLPSISELFNPNFLDVLLPAPQRAKRNGKADDLPAAPANPMVKALKGTTRQTHTQNKAKAYSGTDSALVNAFSGISRHTQWSDLQDYLGQAWKEDPSLTLKIIWNLRSIHDGKGEREIFYRAFGWLLENHPRTAISNLPVLVEPVCELRKKRASSSHGYWKDLLNILALATVGELTGVSGDSKFLHHERQKYTYPDRSKKTRSLRPGTPASRQADSLAKDAFNKDKAARKREIKEKDINDRLAASLADPKYQALFVAVARLFADQLVKDFKLLQEADSLGADEDKIKFLKQLSFAGKWAPSPGGSHDKVTKIATAISELIYASQGMPSYPSALKNASITPIERAHVLRSFYQRWILTELRRASSCPEPLMAADRWTEIEYNRVPSICMKNNTENFFMHDEYRFEEYLVSVERGKKKISGATLLPHELVAQVITLSKAARRAQWASSESSSASTTKSRLKEVQAKLSEIRMRVVEAQWKSLIKHLKQAGTLDNCLAICDVSGSMGSLYGTYDKKHPQPVLVAVALSLILSTLAKGPFGGGFITFSASPQYLTVDVYESLAEQINTMAHADAGLNTDFRAVFLDLLLPLAIEKKIKPEDMIKRLFVFSDMQFDAATKTNVYSAKKKSNAAAQRGWETNHDAIERAYTKAGYEMPEIVYWDLAASGVRVTKETEDSKKKGVAMMNGFSPAMLKVFMGEDEDEKEWAKIGTSKGDEFTPENIMKKALLKKSFDGLKVID